MSKIDLKTDLKHLYKPSAKSVMTVDPPATRFLLIDEHGDPNASTDYAGAFEVLFAVSDAAKFAVKRGATVLTAQ